MLYSNIEKIFFISICIFITNAHKSFSQNLVPNGSFEDRADENFIITSFKQESPITGAKYWFNPSITSPDYFHSKYGGNYNVPNTSRGKQEAKDGSAYAGISVFYSSDNYEYVSVKLNQTLIKDKHYSFSLYINPTDQAESFTNQIHFSLTNEEPKSETQFTIPVKYTRIIADYMDNLNQWYEMSAIYKADGGEEYLTVGFFSDSLQIIGKGQKYDPKNPIPKKEIPSLYFYLDDIRLIELPDSLFEKPFVLKNILFDIDKSSLVKSSFDELDSLVQYLKDKPGLNMKINGHTDNTGSESANLKLSEARAKTVSDYLVKMGVNSSRIQSAGFGSTVPIALNDTDENRKLNRRVEIEFLKN